MGSKRDCNSWRGSSLVVLPRMYMTHLMTRVKTMSNRTTHGMRHTREYAAWIMMKARCKGEYKPKGITVCDRWVRSFEAFYVDMGARPPGCSLDRIDTYGNYEPNNCRWATAKQQANNTRRNALLTFDGVTRTQAEWADLMSMNRKTLRSRLHLGWSLQEVLFTPVKRCINSI